MKKDRIIQKLVGPIFTIYTPFVEDKSSINFEQLENYINFLFNNARVNSVPHTGQFISLA